MLDDYYDDDDGYDDNDYDDYDDQYVAPPKKPVVTKPGLAPKNNATTKKLQQQPPPAPKSNNKLAPATTSAKKKHNYASAALPVSSPPGVVTSKKHASNTTTTAGGALPARIATTTKNPPSTTTTAASPSPNSLVASSLSSSSSLPTPSAVPPPPVPEALLQTTTSQKKPFTLVILGHVDAGKSTVTGHLLYAASSSTSMKRPTNFAYLCDEDIHEQSHGITMDVAIKTLETLQFSMVLQDSPGHADYIPAMITGAAHADAALLVVDATDVKTALYHGQLKEHVWVMRGMGVSQVLVVVNKMDLVSWNRDIYHDTCDQVGKFLKYVGFAPAKIRYVPVSGLDGTNVAQRDVEHHLDWYYQDDNASMASTTLLEMLDGFDAPLSLPMKLSKPLRAVVTDVVGEQGRGVAVRIKILQGWVQTGESLLVLPIGDVATIAKISSLQQLSTKFAGASEVLDCSLMGIDATRVSIGNVLARPGAVPRLSSQCRCQLWVLDTLTIPILRGTQAIFHISHLDVPCYISQLIQATVKNVVRPRPKAIAASSQAIVEITLSNPIVLEPFAECRALGRFVLRRGGDSIAVGRIDQVIH